MSWNQLHKWPAENAVKISARPLNTNPSVSVSNRAGPDDMKIFLITVHAKPPWFWDRSTRSQELLTWSRCKGSETLSRLKFTSVTIIPLKTVIIKGSRRLNITWKYLSLDLGMYLSIKEPRKNCTSILSSLEIIGRTCLPLPNSEANPREKIMSWAS